ncbi:MAG: rod-binding protein [Pseudomonadota bacterium]
MTNPFPIIEPVEPRVEPSAQGPKAPLSPDLDASYRRVAQEFEAVFLAEMLKHTGLARPPESFGGGAGEAQFAPMLVKEHANALAQQGGIGLADQVYRALRERDGL